MKIDITCNTEDEILFRNIARNSRRDLEWIAETPEHDGHAVIVGGGPSASDHIESIRWRQSLGQKIFALNGAATWLQSHGIAPDYQIILDARPETAGLLGDAQQYLIASQCDPECFESISPDRCILWHPKLDGIESHLPDARESLTLIGGGTTVGLSAMCLAYTMGYRKLHLFGYDSSHREGAGHAYAQPMNDREPICKVTVFGKTFKSSLAMAKQAEFFPQVCDNLIDLGCVITVDGDGLLPFISHEIAKQPAMTEQDKYQQMWGFDQYRAVAPGESVAPLFVELTGVGSDDVVIDFGCGTGRGAKMVHELSGCKFTLIDFTDNSLDADIAKEDWFTLVQHDLTQPIELSSAFGFCTDMMEHIRPEDVDAVIANIMDAADKVLFQISLVDDNCGVLIRQPLHLSVHDCGWWQDKFESLGFKIAHQEDQGIAAIYYVVH